MLTTILTNFRTTILINFSNYDLNQISNHGLERLLRAHPGDQHDLARLPLAVHRGPPGEELQEHHPVAVHVALGGEVPGQCVLGRCTRVHIQIQLRELDHKFPNFELLQRYAHKEFRVSNRLCVDGYQ